MSINFAEYQIGKKDYYSEREKELLKDYKEYPKDKKEYYVYNIIMDDYSNRDLSIEDRMSIAYHLYYDKKWTWMAWHIEELFCENDDYDNASLFLNEAIESLKNTSTSPQVMYFEYAKMLLRMKTFKEALPYFELIIENRPSSYHYSFFIQHAYLEDKDAFKKYTADKYLTFATDADKDLLKELLIAYYGSLTENQKEILKRKY